jgi:hypothetical protein
LHPHQRAWQPRVKEQGEEEEEDPRLVGKKKRKVALMLAYLGTNYKGIQYLHDGIGK